MKEFTKFKVNIKIMIMAMLIMIIGTQFSVFIFAESKDDAYVIQSFEDGSFDISLPKLTKTVNQDNDFEKLERILQNKGVLMEIPETKLQKYYETLQNGRTIHFQAEYYIEDDTNGKIVKLNRNTRDLNALWMSENGYIGILSAYWRCSENDKGNYHAYQLEPLVQWLKKPIHMDREDVVMIGWSNDAYADTNTLKPYGKSLSCWKYFNSNNSLVYEERDVITSAGDDAYSCLFKYRFPYHNIPNVLPTTLVWQRTDITPTILLQASGSFNYFIGLAHDQGLLPLSGGASAGISVKGFGVSISVSSIKLYKSDIITIEY